MKKTAAGLALALSLLVSLSAPAMAAAPFTAALEETAAYVYEAVPAPQVGSTGGEWAVLGLARSDYQVPATYYQTYYAAVEAAVKETKGILHEKKYTEYSRVIAALTAIGKDPRDVAGYDLTLPLGDYDKTVWQGVNGPIWALIALDSAGYPMPQNPDAATQATRQLYVDCILDKQLPDGGWSLAGTGTSEPDITGMALQALANYQDQPAVAQAIEKALACMSAQQDADGGFSSLGTDNVESCVQMVVALCELDLPIDDPRFVKEGRTMLDNLLSYRQPGGSFRHTAESGSNQMATEQGLYALAALQRKAEGKNSLYDMSDALDLGGGEAPATGAGLPGKDPAVTSQPVTLPDKTFADAADHVYREAVEALAARKIVDGKGDGLFHPDDGLTRAEFAAIAVRALGLTGQTTDAFPDVAADAWYAPYVGAAHAHGLINGKGDGSFDPEGPITRQEAAVLVTRAAGLCGMETGMDPMAVRDTLAQFTDYVTTAQWARDGLAFCYAKGLLDDSALEIHAADPILRGEMAQMLYRLLGSANLL